MRFDDRKFAKRSLLTILALLISGAVSVQAQEPRTLAVLSFTLGEQAKQTAKSSLHIEGDLGRDLEHELVAKLFADRKFKVIERENLPDIAKELMREGSAGFDPQSAAQIGKLSGLDYVVIGSVTQLSGSDEPTPVGRFSNFTGYVERKATVDVEITARLIVVSTGEIVSSSSGKGQAAKTYRLYKNTKIDTASTSFGDGTLRDATLKAIDSMADQLEAFAVLPIHAPTMPASGPARASYKGVVADVSGQTLILTSGSSAGAKVGDVVHISRFDHNVYSPTDPKVVIKVVTQPVGTANITEVDESTATATFSGTGPPMVKDMVTYAP